MKPETFSECMDIFDWFDDPNYEYLNHIWLSKLDAKARISRALPAIIQHAATLLAEHASLDDAYPPEDGHRHRPNPPSGGRGSQGS